MYSVQRFFGLAKILDKHPLYLKIRGKTLRLTVSKITAGLVRKQSSKILKKKKIKFFYLFLIIISYLNIYIIILGVKFTTKLQKI